MKDLIISLFTPNLTHECLGSELPAKGSGQVQTPTCFISYSWDSEQHKAWVRMLAEKLTQSGVHVYLDQWDIELGSDLPGYMESSVESSDYVVLVCTPNFAVKANARKGGVGYEKSIVTGAIFFGAPEGKFVPLLRSGTPRESLPTYLKSKEYVDFRDNREFDVVLDKLLRHMYKSPRYSRPALGQPPSFGRIAKPRQIQNEATSKPARDNVAAIREISEYATSYLGMNLLGREARDFADWWLEHCSDRDFDEFRVVYSYASGYLGMGLSNAGAMRFAKRWMTDYARRNFTEFQDLYSHASSYLGMGLPQKDAIEFALKHLPND